MTATRGIVPSSWRRARSAWSENRISVNVRWTAACNPWRRRSVGIPAGSHTRPFRDSPERLRTYRPPFILDRMSEVTRIVSAIEQGDPQAAEQLLPLVYDELRKLAAQKLAQEKPGQTLQATALVQDVHLRLVGRTETGRFSAAGGSAACAGPGA